MSAVSAWTGRSTPGRTPECGGACPKTKDGLFVPENQSPPESFRRRQMAPSKWTTTNRALDRFVKRQLEETSTPGVAVGILHKGRRYTAGYGITNVDHPLPVAAETLFQIGSTTKTFTATAIMKLVEQGLVDLDVPVRRYLPELRLKDPEVTRKVTLHHLLTHMGGWLGDYFTDTGWGHDAIERAVEELAKVKQLTPLGTVWAYNNAGFYIAGRIIEKITKQPFEQAMKEMLFDPLEMKNSFWFPEEVMLHRFVVGHITVGKKSRVASPWRLSRSSAPAGAIISDVGDQLTWAEFHMGDGKAKSGKRVLKRSTLRAMQKVQFYVGNMAEEMGLSWMINTIDGVKFARHGGTTNGQLSAFVMAPEEGFAVTVLTNSTAGRTVHRDVVRWAIEHYLGLRPEKPKPIKLDPAELERYTGKYRVGTTKEFLEVSVRGPQVVLKFPEPEPTDGQPVLRIKPIPFDFVAPDKVVAVAGPYAGLKADFLRSPSNRIVWFRFGGRLYRRVRT